MRSFPDYPFGVMLGAELPAKRGTNSEMILTEEYGGNYEYKFNF